MKIYFSIALLIFALCCGCDQPQEYCDGSNINEFGGCILTGIVGSDTLSKSNSHLATKGISNAVVCLVPENSAIAMNSFKREEELTPVFLNYLNEKIYPEISVVQINQPVVIRFAEKGKHTAHIRSKNATTVINKFEGDPLSHTTAFKNPELFVRIICDVHHSEQAYLAVISGGWYCLTNSDGTYSLSTPILPGKYSILIAHPSFQEVRKSIEILNGDSVKHMEIKMTSK